jgi:hypothetical protein
MDKMREFYKQIKPFVREKFAFSAKPLGNIGFINLDEPGMQFEEIRAQTYTFAYELFRDRSAAIAQASLIIFSFCF